MSGWKAYKPLLKLLAVLAIAAAVTYVLWYGNSRTLTRDAVPRFSSMGEVVDLLSASVEAEDDGGKLYHLWYYPDDGDYMTLRMDALRGAELVTTYLVVDGARQEHGSGWYSVDFGVALVVTNLEDGEDPEDVEAVEVWERSPDGTGQLLRRFPIRS